MRYAPHGRPACQGRRHPRGGLQVIAAKDGYQPIAKLARIIRGSSVTLNFSLNKS